MIKKKGYLNRMILVCGGSALLTFVIYLYYTNRTPRYYYIPKDYNGWVTIRFEKEGAPPLKEVDGALELRIPASGILETSSTLESGWARDAFYWTGDPEEIPRSIDVGGESMRYIHDREETPPDYTRLILSMKDGVDTLLWDGSRISKNGDNVEVRTGRNLLEHFYHSVEPAPFFFAHDSVPETRKLW